MGDTTSFQVTINACPDDQQADVMDIIAGYQLGEDWGPAAGSRDALRIGDQYTAHDISVGVSDEFAANLIDAAPGCSFTCWEDPKYEWLGSLNSYTPELGLYSAECDANGIPCLPPGTIRAAVASATDAVHAALSAPVPTGGDEKRLASAAVAAVLAEIDKALGKPWLG